MAVRKSVPKNMSKKTRLAKNERIRRTMRATKQRRKNMDCKTYLLKLDYSHLNHKQREALTRLFLEAKWLKNTCIAANRFDRDYLKQLDHKVEVKTPTGIETRNLEVIGGQLAQSIVDELRVNLKTLHVLKTKGHKVGRLRFRKQVTCVNFPQYGNSHKINRQRNRLKLANIPGWIRVNGLNQLPEEAEIANLKLIHTPGGYYARITTYINKRKEEYEPNTAIGLDMGIRNHLTLSNGVKIDTIVGETERTKRLRRKLKRQTRGSNNYRKTWTLINKELAKQTNRRGDIANKIVHELLKNEMVFFQDEQITGWKNKKTTRGGRRLQGSILGRVKNKLKNHPRTIMLDKNLPTTATCVCGTITPTPLWKHTFTCPACGHKQDRDIHAALNMIRLGQSINIPAPEQSRTLVEKPVTPSAVMCLAHVTATGWASVKQEAATSSALP